MEVTVKARKTGHLGTGGWAPRFERGRLVCVFLRNTCTVYITGYNSNLTLSLCLSDKQLRMYKHSYTVSRHI